MGLRSHFSFPVTLLRPIRQLLARDPDPSARPQYRVACEIYRRLLGVTYLVAFVSLWVQADGLFGERGISPVSKFLQVVAAQLGEGAFWRVPSLFWLTGAGALHLFCLAGVALSLVVIAGRLQGPALLGLWALYLSFVSIGEPFLDFQWDALLLEAGLLAIFLFPDLRAVPRRPSKLALWLHWWLLFRLTFASGLVKLTSGDPTWRDLTALRYHYFTQPLPNPLAWLAQQLPAGVQTLSAGLMFVVELGAPFAILGPPRLRRLGAWAMIGLQLLIAATGNFAFFNLLTVALCLLLVDDRWWGRWRESWRQAPGGFRFRRADWVAAPLLLVIMPVSLGHMLAATRLLDGWPHPLAAVHRMVAPLRSVNGYGLFQVMTVRRPEILVEGSLDGETWLAYEFRFKPGNLERMPPIVAPHQPRLDWQMWFAALGEARSNPWFFLFLARLAQTSPDVLGLLAEDPFDGEPPRYLRARLYEYRFTDPGELMSGGAWWTREQVGVYLPRTEAAALARLFPDGE